MKTFSDLLATDVSSAVTVVFELEPVSSEVAQRFHGRIEVCGQVVLDGEFPNNAMRFTVTGPLRAPVTVKVALRNKRPELLPIGQDLAFLASLTVNSYPVLPDWQDEIEYVTEDGEQLTPTHYLGHNGKWEFSSKLPFYQWLHAHRPWGWTI